MTRFDAATPAERRKLFADAVAAHRDRGSQFLTAEVAADPELDGVDEEGEPLPAPWVQFAEDTFNLDVTERELDELERLLNEFPEFTVEGMERPEEADGVNVRITARSDANRLAGFADRTFQEVYGREEDYRVWITEI
jgi:hypothetical protein